MPEFTVCRVHSTETISVTVNSSLTVEILKKAIAELFLVPVYQQDLVYKGKKLEDGQILSSLQYVEGLNVIRLLVKKDRPLVKLIIFFPGRKKKKVFLPDNSEIKALRLAVVNLGSLLPERQFKIVFHEKVLEDDTLIFSNYKLKNKSRIFIQFLDS
jgi:hypothetical protein